MQNLIVLGGCYEHKQSDRKMFLIAASTVEDPYAELSSIPAHELYSGQFREIWYGSLEEFDKDWAYNETLTLFNIKKAKESSDARRKNNVT